MASIPQEVLSLQYNEPRKWGELSNILVKEYESEGFQQLLADFLCSAGSEFKKKRADNAPFPYHYEKLFEREDIRYRFQYFEAV